MTRTDPVLAKVMMFTLEGWPKRPKSAQNTAISGDFSRRCSAKRPKLVRNTTTSGDSSQRWMAEWKPYADKQTELSVDKGRHLLSPRNQTGYKDT